MADHFPVYHEALSRNAAHLADAAVSIDGIMQADLSQVTSASELSVAALSALSAPRQRMVLCAWLTKVGIRVLSNRHLGDLRTQLIGAWDDGALRIRLPTG